MQIRISVQTPTMGFPQSRKEASQDLVLIARQNFLSPPYEGVLFDRLFWRAMSSFTPCNPKPASGVSSFAKDYSHGDGTTLPTRRTALPDYVLPSTGAEHISNNDINDMDDMDDSDDIGDSNDDNANNNNNDHSNTPNTNTNTNTNTNRNLHRALILSIATTLGAKLTDLKARADLRATISAQIPPRPRHTCKTWTEHLGDLARRAVREQAENQARVRRMRRHAGKWRWAQIRRAKRELEEAGRGYGEMLGFAGEQQRAG